MTEEETTTTESREFKKIFLHHDADGVTSAYFTSFAFPDAKLQCVDKFGDTSDWQKGDIMCDMCPDDPNVEGLVIDHHFPHPEKHKYKLIPDIPLKHSKYANAIVPASLIAWQEYKDKIPKKEWWKLAIGLAGDGQLELMPTEIYDECPDLLQEVKTSAYESYGQLKVNMFPIYKLLSSPINAFMRKGEYESALNLIRYADTPLDIYTSEDANFAKLDIKNDYKNCIKDANIFNFGNMSIVVYHSRYRMSGYVASAVSNSLKEKTVMAINTRDGSLSMRGKLSTYYMDKMKDIDYIDIGGHHEFKGGKLHKNYFTLIKDLNRIL